MSCYLCFSTLTKAAFAFSILTLLCTHFEQTSSHLNPIHQRAGSPATPSIFPRLSWCYSNQHRFTKVTLCKCPESSCQFWDISQLLPWILSTHASEVLTVRCVDPRYPWVFEDIWKKSHVLRQIAQEKKSSCVWMHQKHLGFSLTLKLIGHYALA